MAIILGIIIQAIFGFPFIFGVSVGSLAIILSFYKGWFLYILIAALSAMNTSLQAPMGLVQPNRNSLFSGTVISEDHREYYVKLLIGIDRAFINNKPIDYRIPVEFYAREHNTFLGRRLLIKGKIKAAEYLGQPNILAGDIIKKDIKDTFLGEIFNSVREYINNQLKAFLKNEHYNLGIGLILGGSGRLQKNLREIFSRTGVLHILAVSGLHVGFVCMFAGFILLFIPISARVKFFIIMLVLFLYAGITGFRPSVCRATLMAFLFGISLVLQRNVDGIHVVNITAITFLVINPLIIFDVGAQLSFAAVYGILFLYPRLENNITKRIKNRTYKFALKLMAVSFSAQLFVSPLLVYYFHRLPTLAVISNFIIVPVASVTIFLLFFSLITGVFFSLFARFIIILVSALLNILITICKLISSIPFSTISLYASPVVLLLSYFIYPKNLRKSAVFSIVIIAIVFSLSSLSNCITIRNGPIGTLISTSWDEHIFISLKHQAVKNNIFLARQHINKLDYLIASNNFYPVEKAFVKAPDRLHTKQVKLGEIAINVGKQINVIYGGRKIILNNYDFQNTDTKGKLIYLITDGENVQSFTTPLYGSIIDQIVLDIKVVFTKLKFLF